jgi:hypothetical protein
MAIQFFCVACRQPIEVDDVMANQTVTCPYCRKVVTAPAATDATFRDNPPIARTPETVAGPPPLPYAVEMPSGPNRWSWASLVCISITMICLAIYIGVIYNIARSLPKDANPQQTNKLLMQEMQARPGLQIILTTGLCVTPVIAVICGIVALVKKTPPRWPAIAALSVCGLFILLMCAGAIFAAATAANKGGG